MDKNSELTKDDCKKLAINHQIEEENDEESNERTSNRAKNYQEPENATLSSAFFNNAMFQSGQMPMQAFQNVIAQFSKNTPSADQEDQEGVSKNFAILQSALFSMQQQQFLQFQLIQHLQSQLVKQSNEEVNQKSDDEDVDDKKHMEHNETDEEDGDIDEKEMERQNEYHKRLLEYKNSSAMDAIIKDNENR